ncbi:MAG: hypothetical protein IT379_08640 [Deltaproteobacteria bacterium]|nr:hypothetical protein [Deltaproteobacteria bacterium]
MRRFASVLLLALVVPLAVACGDDDDDECAVDQDCELGQICNADRRCAPAPAMRCETDVDCRTASRPSLCGTTGTCTAVPTTSCPDAPTMERLCAVTGGEGAVCVGELFVACDPEPTCTACESDCTRDGCSDGDGGEPLDLGRDASEPDSGPPPAGCGNGTIEGDEECDPPAPVGCSLRGCSADCRFTERTPACGDGCLDDGESCGESMSGGCASGERCRGCACEASACGDGSTDDGEACGEPGLPDCASDLVCRDCLCVSPECGNGIAEPAEECGEPGLPTCGAREECTGCLCTAIAPTCGDGFADPGELCGEPGLADCAAGSSCVGCQCSVLCGDGNADPGETCGEPGLADCDAASTCIDCTCARNCGNGSLDPAEECDPPTVPTCSDSSYCGPDCVVLPRTPVCGNGCIDLGEECGEPGFGVCPGGAACNDCRCFHECGNGIVEITETCDPPSAPTCGSLTYCNATCQTTPRATGCGDPLGCIDVGEECEGEGSFCRNPPALRGTCRSCICQRCGDGRVEPGEACDPTDPDGMLPDPGCPGAVPYCYSDCRGCNLG